MVGAAAASVDQHAYVYGTSLTLINQPRKPNDPNKQPQDKLAYVRISPYTNLRVSIQISHARIDTFHFLLLLSLQLALIIYLEIFIFFSLNKISKQFMSISFATVFKWAKIRHTSLKSKNTSMLLVLVLHASIALSVQSHAV